MPVRPAPQTHRLVAGHGYCGPMNKVMRPSGRQDWALIYTINGSGRFGHEGGELSTRPGDVTAIRPATLQDYGLKLPCPEWELVWAHFHPRPAWLAWLEWPEVAPGLMNISLGG